MALDYIHKLKAKEGDKLYIARGWINRSMVAGDFIPQPVCWIIRADGIAHATEICRNIKLVFDFSVLETIRYEIETISDRAVVLTFEAAERALNQIGVPVFFNSHYHSLDDMLIVPFTEATGFSKIMVEDGHAMIDELSFYEDPS